MKLHRINWLLVLLVSQFANSQVIDHGRLTNPKQNRIKPEAITLPEIESTNRHAAFPEMEFPSSIMDINKASYFESFKTDTVSAETTHFDRIPSAKLLENSLKKKTNLLKNTMSLAQANTATNKFSDSKANDFTRRLEDLKKQKIITNLKLNKKMGNLSGNKWTLPKYLSKNKPQPRNMTMLTGEVPVIQVIDNAISIIENMLNTTKIELISAKDATKLLSIITNASEILKILQCFDGLENALYYNVKTGISQKYEIEVNHEEQISNNEEQKTVTKIETPKSDTVDVIEVVNHAVNVVEDLLNNTIIEKVDSNNKTTNTIMISQEEANDMAHAVDAIKEILQSFASFNTQAATENATKFEEIPAENIDSTVKEEPIIVDLDRDFNNEES